MTFPKIFLLSVFLVILPLSVTQAEEPVHCGSPDEIKLKTESEAKFCDIYQRQLEYRESWKQLRADLLERQESYAKPRRAAYQQYRKDLESIHGTLGE